MFSDLPEIKKLQENIDAEINSKPELRAPIIELLKRLREVKAAINTAAKKHDSGSNCDSIRIVIEENGLFSYKCVTFGLIEENEVVLTEVGEKVMEDLRSQGYTNLVFLYSEFPF